MATCFGPITYPPESVLAFKEFPDGNLFNIFSRTNHFMFLLM